MTTDFLFILDFESFHIVSANNSCGGCVFWSAQRSRWVWEKGEKLENLGQESGKVWAFVGGSGGCQKSFSTYEVGTL